MYVNAGTNPLANAERIDVAVSDIPVEESVRILSTDNGEKGTKQGAN